MITIRHAKIEDSAQLLPLMEQLGYPQTTETLTERLSTYLAIPHHFAFVAEYDGEIAGLLAMASVEAFVHQGKKYCITALIVEETYRGKGIGRNLMEHAEIFAKEHEGKIIELTSGLRRAKDGSHEFYKALGYKNEGPMAKLYLRKELT